MVMIFKTFSTVPIFTHNKSICFFHNILIFTHKRLSHILNVLNTWDPHVQLTAWENLFLRLQQCASLLLPLGSKHLPSEQNNNDKNTHQAAQPTTGQMWTRRAERAELLCNFFEGDYTLFRYFLYSFARQQLLLHSNMVVMMTPTYCNIEFAFLLYSGAKYDSAGLKLVVLKSFSQLRYLLVGLFH